MDIVWCALIGAFFLSFNRCACRRLRAADAPEENDMSAIYVIGAVVAVLLLGYLVYALIKAEDL